MTGKGTVRKADARAAQGRLENARAFKAAAENTVAALRGSDNANPAISLIVHAAIAYADAVTAKFAGYISSAEHGAAPKALRHALGKRLPTEQERRFGKLIGEKNESEYGARIGKASDARELFEQLERFAKWAEQELGG